MLVDNRAAGRGSGKIPSGGRITHAVCGSAHCIHVLIDRLLTNLINNGADPPSRLMQPHHERWEIESAYFALRHTLLKGHMLRSKDLAGATQEMWDLLVPYQPCDR
ncbi:hypothetical protein ABZT03_31045 [Streptomyces sp. NPDC005574]|uniref:hypothetical protein n=1 Tax=Streptomyces sp. NPDC005574 TaxID=3156891 RepID=UPI0033A750A8